MTNGPWRNPEVADVLLQWFDLIEVSVDAGGPEQYEEARAGASFGLLRSNLELLRRRRAETGSDAAINIRLMIRPSTNSDEDSERELWTGFGDGVRDGLRLVGVRGQLCSERSSASTSGRE